MNALITTIETTNVLSANTRQNVINDLIASVTPENALEVYSQLKALDTIAQAVLASATVKDAVTAQIKDGTTNYQGAEFRLQRNGKYQYNKAGSAIYNEVAATAEMWAKRKKALETEMLNSYKATGVGTVTKYDSDGTTVISRDQITDIPFVGNTVLAVILPTE